LLGKYPHVFSSYVFLALLYIEGCRTYLADGLNARAAKQKLARRKALWLCAVDILKNGGQLNLGWRIAISVVRPLNGVILKKLFLKIVTYLA